MKRASNSLLTLCPIPFQAIPDAPVFPRAVAGADGRHLTPFFVHRENAEIQLCVIPGLPCPPRSFVRYRLGEGRIRSLLHYICLLLTACAMLASVPNLPGADGLIIQLKEEATIQSNIISLRDVADLRGADPSVIQKLAAVELGRIQESGSVVAVNRQQIRESVESTAGSLTGATFIGAAVVRVRLQTRQADPNVLDPFLKSHLLEATSWKGSEIEILSLGGLNGIEWPTGDYELRFSSKATLAGPRRMLAPVEILQGGKTLRRFWITADVTVRASILTASRGIPVERIITPEDVLETVSEIPDLRTAYARRPEDLLGKASRRLFSPGDPLTREAFAEPFLVRHGETVQLRLERKGIVLTSLAKAEQDGRLGQMITVRNLDFSTTLKAEVTGPASVKVQ